MRSANRKFLFFAIGLSLVFASLTFLLVDRLSLRLVIAVFFSEIPVLLF
jgi:hypothetical protein